MLVSFHSKPLHFLSLP